MAKRSVGIIALLIIVAIGLAAAVTLIRKAMPPEPTHPKPAALALAETDSWQETHATFEMHAQVRGSRPDTAYMSRVVADLPQDVVKNGGTLQFLVTVPDWAVFDGAGKLYEGGDGVVLTASNPDIGIGLEIARIEMRPSLEPGDRKWHTLIVNVPPCMRRIALEALPGVAIDANNSFDRMIVSPPNGMAFHKALFARLPAGTSESCGDPTAKPADALDVLTGASLHTGPK